MSTIEVITAHLPAAMLVMFRIGGLMIFAPMFSSPAIPVRVRILLTFSLGLAVYPLLSQAVLPTQDLDLSLWTLAPMAVAEVTLGAVIGLIAGIPLVTAQTAGLVMGQQMGLGFARLYNPALDDEGDVLGQALFMLAMAGFLLIGGHEQTILATLHSFEHVSLGAFASDEGLVTLLAGLLTASLELALRVSAPLLALVFLETIAMGFVAKTVPQLNILSLGFPVRILAGLLVIAAGLVVIDEVLMEGVDELFESLFGWVETA